MLFFVLQAVDVENMHVLHHYDVHKLCNLIPGSDKWQVSQFLLNWKLWTRDKYIYRHQAVFEWAWGDNAIRRKTIILDCCFFSEIPRPPTGWTWVFPKMLGFSPQIIPCLIGFFHDFHHPFWGKIPYFWKWPLYSKTRAINSMGFQVTVDPGNNWTPAFQRRRSSPCRWHLGLTDDSSLTQYIDIP